MESINLDHTKKFFAELDRQEAELEKIEDKLKPNELISFENACKIYPELLSQNVDKKLMGIVLRVNERYGKKNQKFFQVITCEDKGLVENATDGDVIVLRKVEI